MPLKGYFFDGKTSARQSAEVIIDDASLLRLYVDGANDALQMLSLVECRVSHRLANTPRFIFFPDGSKFETTDNDGVDVAVKSHRQINPWMNLVHQLESHSLFVLITLVVIGVLSWYSYAYGLPKASRFIAFHLPPTVMNSAASQTLTLLDKTQLGPTQLPQEVQQRVRAHFKQAIIENKDLNLNVIFRDGKDMGANAFALPDGTILFTDAMVKMAENDDELLAVFAHEIGHVKYRHALRAAIQNSSLGIFVSVLVGDASGASSLIVTLPLVLTTMAYSRDFEREADNNALEYLQAKGIDTLSFVNLMERVTKYGICYAIAPKRVATTEPKPEKTPPQGESTQAEPPGTAAPTSPEDQLAQCKKRFDDSPTIESDSEKKLIQYLSSHPATEERLERFRHPAHH